MRCERKPASNTGWVWRPRASARGCVVDVPGPGRSRFWTTLTDPGTVIAFEAMDDIALRGLGRLFGRDWYERVSASAPQSTDDVAWAPGPLPESWRRVALVEAVDQWLPWPLDQDLLAIDRALAWDAAGARGQAAVTIASCSARVVALRQAALAGDLTPSASDIVRQGADLLVGVLVDDDPDRRALLDLQAQTAVDVGPNDFADLDAFLDGSMALTLGDLETGPNLDASLDLGSVSPRVLEWAGPDLVEIRADADPASDAVVACVRLAEGVDPDDGEACHLVGYLADASTGEVLLSRRFAGGNADDPAELQVALPLAGRPSSGLVVGLFQAGLRGRLRTSPAGRALVRVERLLVAAWAEARRRQARNVPAPDRAAALDAALAGYREVALVHPPSPADEADYRADLAQADCLGRLAALRAEISPLDQAQRPLLAELFRG